jgi:cell wall-associated NlpC family hydrolase
MPIQPSTRQPPDGPPVPSLLIVPQPRPASSGAGSWAGFTPWRGLRASLIALVVAVVVAVPAFALSRDSGHHAAALNVPAVVLSAASRLQSRTIPTLTGAGSAVTHPGVRLTVAGGRSAIVVRHAHTGLASPPPSSTHDFTPAQVLQLADGSSPYMPPTYLAAVYRELGNRYSIPWRMLAALEYIQGGYTSAIAGASAPAAQTATADANVDGQRAVNSQVLSSALAAASQPSATLVSDARKLVADGVAQSPAAAVYKYMGDDTASQQAVLTLAQSIGASTVTPTAGPMVKLVAMRAEAHLLNGIPYLWGGGHGGPAWVVGSGYDCSGFVSEVLHAGGYLSGPQTTQTLPGLAGIANGPGKYVTIYDRTVATVRVWVKKKKIVTVKQAKNPDAAGVHVVKGRQANSNTVSIQLPRWVGEWTTLHLTKLVPSADTTNNDEHVIIDLDGQWWESGGSTADGGAADVHQIMDPNPGYLKTFNRILHPTGL